MRKCKYYHKKSIQKNKKLGKLQKKMKELGFYNFSFRIIERLKVTNKKEVKERVKYWKLRAILATMY